MVDRICVIVSSSDLEYGRQLYVQELAYIGLSIGDQAFCNTYNLDTLVGIQNDPVIQQYALVSNGIPISYDPGNYAWFEVYEHVRGIWNDYKSVNRPYVGVLGTDVVETYLRHFGVETVDLLEMGMPTDIVVEKEDCCSGHDEDHWDCCQVGKVIAARRWCQLKVAADV